MSIKLWIIIICSVIIYNIYYDKNILSKIKNYKKYYKIGMVLILGFGAITIIATIYFKSIVKMYIFFLCLFMINNHMIFQCHYNNFPYILQENLTNFLLYQQWMNILKYIQIKHC